MRCGGVRCGLRATLLLLSGGNSGATLFVLDAALASDAPCTLPPDSESVASPIGSSGVLSSLVEPLCMHCAARWRFTHELRAISLCAPRALAAADG